MPSSVIVSGMKKNLYFASHSPAATLPRPKLARKIFMFQRKALIKAEVTAPLFRTALFLSGLIAQKGPLLISASSFCEMFCSGLSGFFERSNVCFI